MIMMVSFFQCWPLVMFLFHVSINFACKCDGNIGEAVEQEEKLFYEVETVREFTYLAGRVSADAECDIALTAITRCGWV